MSKKDMLLSVFEDDGIKFRYTLKDLTGATYEFEVQRGNKFKPLKRYFRKHMDENLQVRYKGLLCTLVSAEMVVEETEPQYSSLGDAVDALIKEGKVDYINTI